MIQNHLIRKFSELFHYIQQSTAFMSKETDRNIEYCYEDGCDGTIIAKSGPGRTRVFKGIELPIPDELELPTCNKCGDLLLDKSHSIRLAEAMRSIYNKYLSDEVRASNNKNHEENMTQLTYFDNVTIIPETWAEYAALQRPTAGNYVNNLPAIALALCGETQEVSDAGTDFKKVTEEVGDVLWGLSLLIDTMNTRGFNVVLPTRIPDSICNAYIEFNGDDEFVRNLMQEGLIKQACRIAECVKKHEYQGHPFNASYVAQVIESMVNDCGTLLAIYHTHCAHACGVNLAKLAARYPNGFSSQASINRKV